MARQERIGSLFAQSPATRPHLYLACGFIREFGLLAFSSIRYSCFYLRFLHFSHLNRCSFILVLYHHHFNLLCSGYSGYNYPEIRQMNFENVLESQNLEISWYHRRCTYLHPVHSSLVFTARFCSEPASPAAPRSRQAGTFLH